MNSFWWGYADEMILGMKRSRLFFFFKQKTAYEIVSRDWSSDVCSSDLRNGQYKKRGAAATRNGQYK